MEEAIDNSVCRGVTEYEGPPARREDDDGGLSTTQNAKLTGLLEESDLQGPFLLHLYFISILLIPRLYFFTIFVFAKDMLCFFTIFVFVIIEVKL